MHACMHACAMVLWRSGMHVVSLATGSALCRPATQPTVASAAIGEGERVCFDSCCMSEMDFFQHTIELRHLSVASGDFSVLLT